ncbi:DUF1697 domain-containing protein [Candidatus Dojkabacteria bacterium]|uniref:DUF1697 domain-containing protein n=1 Tax=Candidatus Dojkabacteria bacterium TaxID=2099670 RepID=A0A955L260_9BACT|nr:DUF1697 domain-containing protein [Candidatus Dojkabacteria bacterium]
MNKYVAFLRGINSGKNPSTKMGDIKALFKQIGFEKVDSVLASGNIIFESDEDNLKEKIDSEFEKEFGFNPNSVIRSEQEITDIINKNLFPKDLTKSQKTNVSFLLEDKAYSFSVPFEQGCYKILEINNKSIFSIVDIDNGSTLDLMKFLDDEFGKDLTTRTFGTVGKVYKKMTQT